MVSKTITANRGGVRLAFRKAIRPSAAQIRKIVPVPFHILGNRKPRHLEKILPHFGTIHKTNVLFFANGTGRSRRKRCAAEGGEAVSFDVDTRLAKPDGPKRAGRKA
jgi:hypothetical protein